MYDVLSSTLSIRPPCGVCSVILSIKPHDGVISVLSIKPPGGVCSVLSIRPPGGVCSVLEQI